MWGVHDGMGWWMVFGGFLWLLFWVTVVYLVVAGFARLDRGREADAAEIARRRLARGELTAEEFERIRRELAER